MKKKKQEDLAAESLSEKREHALAEAIRASAEDGRIPCARAFGLARELKVPVGAVGRTADRIGIRIARCQLGCF